MCSLLRFMVLVFGFIFTCVGCKKWLHRDCLTTVEVSLLTLERAFAVPVYKNQITATSKPVTLCYKNGWEIFMNEAVKFIKLLVLGNCKESVTLHDLWMCFQFRKVWDSTVRFRTLSVIKHSFWFGWGLSLPQGLVDNQPLLPKSSNVGKINLSHGFRWSNRGGKAWSETECIPYYPSYPLLGRKHGI